MSEVFPVYFGLLERALAHSKSGGYLVGGALSVADLALLSHVNRYSSGGLEGVSRDVVSKNFPATQALRDRVAGHPKVVEWYSTHQ